MAAFEGAYTSKGGKGRAVRKGEGA